MHLKKGLLLTLLLLNVVLAYAQPRSFSRKPNVYIQEYNQYLKTGITKGGEVILTQFTEKWNAGHFPESEQRLIIRVSNEMLMNELDIPAFELYTETILLGKDSVAEGKYTNWKSALIPAVRSGNNTFLALLNASRNLFKDNTLYKSDTKMWYASSDNYLFDFSNNRVKITFTNVDLVCQAHVDRLAVYNTNGSYYLDNNIWQGSDGKVGWERVGFGLENIHAEIKSKYTIRFDKAELVVDTVLFTNKDFLGRTLLGSYRDRASSADHIKEENLLKSNFPQFTSFEKNMELGTYLDGMVKFKGGYSMKGAEIISKGSPASPSTVEIYYKGKPRVIAKSQYFSLKDNKIVSRTTAVTITTDSGRIYHPNILFNLNLENKILLLTRGKEGLKKAPFFDNDHQVEIFVDQVIWKLDLPKIEFDMSGDDSKAIVESSNFYKDVRYERIPRGMLKYHPLSRMREFVITYRMREFTFTDYANWMGSKQTYLRPQIVELADMGYIYFNPETDSIFVRKKLDHAVLSHMKLIDYDVIRFSSVIAARSNGFLNLINNTFTLEGVRAFRFSDSQSVYAFPHEQKVILKNKRRMEFGGQLTAGKFDFYSQRFDFDYYNFDINSDDIDSMRIYTEDFTGANRLVLVKSVLRDINGTLEIDKPTNKSGLEDYPEYPRFTSRKGAKVAYDKKGIHNGAYPKDEFHFAVDPFVIENLDNFSTNELTFPGTFVSGGIIPEFRYQVKIMDDYSLGFEKRNPVGGYPMYGGLGHGEIDIKLSEEGFTAKGELEYQGAKISSDDILLTPDSTLAKAESYLVTEDFRYPNITAMNVNTRWLPKKDSMFVYTGENKATVLRDNQLFDGMLIQTSKQIAGNGLLSWDRAKLTSADMKFKPNMVDAEESKIEIGAIDDDKIAFASYNVNSHVDFNTRIGEFKANEKGNLTEFPFNMYASSMDEYTWDMDAETIELNKGPALADKASYFVSRKHEQQGLRFQSTNALFDMKEGIIYAKEVPYIDVADSRIFPFEEKLTILADAEMEKLEDARMLAARENKYHELYDASLKIHGRYELGGSANYTYKDKHLTGQEVHFTKIRVVGRGDSTVIANGGIADTVGFEVSPKIAYKGGIELRSSDEFIVFSGYVKPLHSFEQYASNWFRYRQQPDPANVIIPAYEILNEDRRRMAAALSIANDSTHVYPSFFTFKRSYADLDITTDTGVMYYNEEEQTFYVGDSLKLFDGSNRGSYLSFNDRDKSIYSEGKLNFNLDVDDNFRGVMAGNASREEKDSTFSINSILALDVNIPIECYDRIVAVLLDAASGNEVADNGSVFIEKALSEYLNDRELDKAVDDVPYTGQLHPSGALDKKFFFSKVGFEYVPKAKSFVSLDPIHIATVNGKQINRVVDAKIEIIKRRSGIRYTMYIKASRYDWFYIDYYMGALTVLSTDKEFNEILKDRGPKMSKGRFRVRSGSPRSVARFEGRLNSLREE